MTTNRTLMIDEPKIAKIKENRWTVYNPSSGAIVFINDEDMQKLLNANMINLTGRKMPIIMEEHQRKLWIDAVIKEEHLEPVKAVEKENQGGLHEGND